MLEGIAEILKGFVILEVILACICLSIVSVVGMCKIIDKAKG